MSYVQAFRKRIETDKRSTYALARVIRKDSCKIENDTVHHVYLPDPTVEPFITTPEGRKKSIADGVPTWGAAGVTSLIQQGSRRYLAANMRDANAPSWPNSPGGACGLYNLVDGKQERFRQAAVREFEEEFMFFRDGREFLPTYKLLSTNDTVIEVYSGTDLVDMFHPFIIGWGTPKDTVTTPMILGTMKLPEDTVLTDGEIVKGKPLCRDTILLDLEDLRKDLSSVKARRFRMKDYELSEVEEQADVSAMPQNPVVMLPIARLRQMSDKEIDELF